MLISNPLKKLQKVINEKMIGKLSFLLSLLCAKVSAWNFLPEHFLIFLFFTDSKSASNFACYDTHIEVL
jgi:hypothetical protein